jgi:hypothetical protein
MIASVSLLLSALISAVRWGAGPVLLLGTPVARVAAFRSAQQRDVLTSPASGRDLSEDGCAFPLLLLAIYCPPAEDMYVSPCPLSLLGILSLSETRPPFLLLPARPCPFVCVVCTPQRYKINARSTKLFDWHVIGN